jgi:4-amino-4-deoxy-L-arabinose transferase-like glycosyltransferase
MGLSDAQASAGLRWAVVGGAALLLLAGLGNVGAWAPDEPRYLQVAEELRTAGRGPSDWVLLHLNGEVYDQKPPLYFWLAAAIGAPRGHVSEIAARLPSGLAGIALVALTLALGTRLFGGRVGVLGAALLLTCFEFARNARRVQLDVLLALCETVALVCFWRIDRGIGTRGWPLFGLHAALGLAVLTKGPVGFLVPVLVMAGYLAWERRLGELPRLLPAWGLLLSLGPALAWLAAAAALAPSGFAGDMVGSNILARFFTGTSHVRPFYYYLDTYPLDCLPWTLLWPAVFVAGRQVFRGSSAPEAREPERRRAWRFLLAWVGASLVFFSLSSGKRGLYLLPTFPAMALLCADSLVRLLAGRARMPRGLATLAAVMGLLFGLLGLEFALAAGTGGSLLLTIPSLGERAAEWLGDVNRPLLLAFGCALVGIAALAVVGWMVLVRHHAAPLLRVGVVVAAVAAIELATFTLLFPALDPLRSARPIAVAAAAATPVDRPIGLLHDRAMAGGLVYYSGRRVVLLREPEDVEAFLRAGGETIVVKARKLRHLDAVTPVEVLARARTGSRQVLVVRPAPGGALPSRASQDDGAARRRAAP